MADPDNDDPVLRQSTRVNAAIAIETQATYDIGKWSTVVFEEYDLDLLLLADALGLSQLLLDFYGISDIAFHHANHALTLHEQAETVGLDHVAYMPVLGIEDPSGEDSLEFAMRHFGL